MAELSAYAAAVSDADVVVTATRGPWSYERLMVAVRGPMAPMYRRDSQGAIAMPPLATPTTPGGRVPESNLLAARQLGLRPTSVLAPHQFESYPIGEPPAAHGLVGTGSVDGGPLPADARLALA